MRVSMISIIATKYTMKNGWYFISRTSSFINHALTIKVVSNSCPLGFYEGRNITTALFKIADSVAESVSTADVAAEPITGIKVNPHMVISSALESDYADYIRAACGGNEYAALKMIAEPEGDGEGAVIQLETVCHIFCQYYTKAKMYAERGTTMRRLLNDGASDLDGCVSASLMSAGMFSALLIAQARLVCVSLAVRARAQTLLSMSVRKKFYIELLSSLTRD